MLRILKKTITTAYLAIVVLSVCLFFLYTCGLLLGYKYIYFGKEDQTVQVKYKYETREDLHANNKIKEI